MQIINYIKFFFYHATNWSLPVAIFSLYHTIRGEKKYGLDTFAASGLNRFTIKRGDPTKSSRYEGVNYFILEDLLSKFRTIEPLEKKFLDVGCGKGRAMVVAAHFGFSEIVGVDFAKELCEEAHKNMTEVKKTFPTIRYKVICDDILHYPITNETVFFLFNPFDEEIMEEFLKKVEQSLQSNPRKIYFIYASPRCRSILEKSRFEVVYHLRKVRYLEGLIAVR